MLEDLRLWDSRAHCVYHDQPWRGPRDLETLHAGSEVMNPLELIPDHFERFFAFFGRGHNEGVVPARIKELARLKVAALNACDT